MKKGSSILLIWLLSAFLVACGTGEELKTSETYVYYVNTDRTALEKQAHEWKGSTPEEVIWDILDAMMEPPDSMEYVSAIPKGVKVETLLLSGGKLDLYFNKAYLDMEKSDEVLCRSALVQTLVQAAGVDVVSILVEGTPLLDKKGIPVGYMQESDFVKNIGAALNSYQIATLNLYFSNAAGNGLVSEKVSVRYNSNMSIEKLIVDQLLKGPGKAGARDTLPPETKLLSISVKNGTCYVNFDSGFLSGEPNIEPRILIYSLVNSIAEGGAVNQVQISVNGKTDIVYQGEIDLSKPIARDLDLVEEIKNE